MYCPLFQLLKLEIILITTQDNGKLFPAEPLSSLLKNVMKIIISKSIYGKSYICGLSAPFTYIGYILSELLDKIPQFPFSEIEIECCNFVYELKDDEGYMQWFRKLPLYRKRKDSVHIYLPKINDELKLNSILEDIEQAFNIILLKNKKNIGYDWNKVQGALINLQNILEIGRAHV